MTFNKKEFFLNFSCIFHTLQYSHIILIFQDIIKLHVQLPYYFFFHTISLQMQRQNFLLKHYIDQLSKSKEHTTIKKTYVAHFADADKCL